MPIQSKNLHYAYYHEYFDGTRIIYEENNTQNETQNAAILNDNNQSLLQIQVSPTQPLTNSMVKHFSLKTTYPGLITGIGITHSQKMKGELSLGFQFDYVTGCPYIPGSSIKGVLRSAFRIDSFVKELLCAKEIKLECDEITALEEAIFGTSAEDADSETTEMNAGNAVCGGKQDVFFDAYPVVENDTILATDYITPHKDIIKNPIPIQFLKIKPNVEFRFCFRLYPSEIGTTTILPDVKLYLFREIILCMGLGAKTNVGYGAFVAV